jgi:hypothetical protein
VLAALHRVDELLGVVDGELDVDDATVEVPLDGPSGAAEHRQHRPVVGQGLGGEPGDALGAGDRGEMFEQQRGDALTALVGIDHERHIGIGAALPALVTGPGHELAAQFQHQRHPVVEVDLGEVTQFDVVERGLGREEATVLGLARLAFVERAQRGGIGRFDRAHEGRLAVAQHHRSRPSVALVVHPASMAELGRTA